MTGKEGDRRIYRTRRLIQNAFVELVLEKGYGEVTIQDILDRADVGRSTFYMHYRDKKDVLENVFARLHAVFEEHAQLGTRVNLLLLTLQFMQEEHRLFKAVLGKQSGGIYVEDTRQDLLRYVRRVMKANSKAKLSPTQFEVVAQYLANAYLALLVWWVDSDMPCPIDELYALMARLIEPGVADVLEISSLWGPLPETHASTGRTAPTHKPKR